MAKNAVIQTTEDTNDMARTPTQPQNKPASILSGLKFSPLKRSAATNIADPTIRVRTKLINAISEMVKHVRAEIAGTTYDPLGAKYVTNDQGQRVKVDVQKRKMLWFWKEGSTFFTEIRYGSSAVDFGAGSAIECGPQLADVIEVYETVTEAVQQGELDDQLAKLSERRGRGKTAPVPEPASPRERLAARATRR